MIRTLLKIIATLVFATLFLSGAYFLAEMGPRGAKKENKRYGNEDQAAKELIVKSLSLEDEYKAKVGINEANAEDIKILEAAYDSLYEYSNIVKFPDRLQLVRMREFGKVIDSFHSKAQVEIIDKLDIEAKDAVSKKEFEKARELYVEAVRIQSELNANYPSSTYASNHRSGYMAREIKLLDARPLYNDTIRAEESAKTAVSEKKWNVALAEYQEAIKVQADINRLYPDLAFASLSRLKALENEYNSLLSAPMSDKIEKIMQSYKDAIAKEEFILAAELIQDAILTQQRLNEQFPKSRFASQSNVQNWKKEQEIAMTMKEALSISKQIKDIDALLRSSNPELMKDIVGDLLKSAEKFRKSAANNTLITDGNVLKLRYLNYMKDNIADIQSEINNSLHSEIFDDKWKMMKSEVSQALYQVIMQDNPSKNKTSDKNPVEYLTRDQIGNFMMRLSWILAREVSLPSVDNYKKAIGDLKYVRLEDIAWYDKNSGGETKEIMTSRPNDIGFFDLLGNVAEYTNDKNIVVGASVKSNSDTLLHLGIETQRDNRSPYTGFRILVAQ